jgi:hypothetical protein
MEIRYSVDPRYKAAMPAGVSKRMSFGLMAFDLLLGTGVDRN